MKVLHIIPNGYVNGTSAHVLSLTRQQVKIVENCKVLIYGENGRFGKMMQDQGAEVKSLNCSSGHDFTICGKLYREIKKNNPDIVHFHSLPLLGAITMRLCNCTTIFTIHGRNSRKSSKITSVFYGSSINGVIAVSNVLRQSCQRANLFPKSMWTVIYNGIDTVRFSPDSEFSYGSDSDKRFDLIMVTRFSKDKHVIDAVRIIHILRKKYNIDARLLLVGAGSQESLLKEEMEKLNIKDYVTFAGEIVDPSSVLKKSHGFLMLSEYETFGIGALEAAACGTPIFSYPVQGGINEWLKDGNGGVFSEDRTPDSLAERIAEVSSHCEHWQSLRISARGLAVKFTEEKMAKETMSFYEEIIKNKIE